MTVQHNKTCKYFIQSISLSFQGRLPHPLTCKAGEGKWRRREGRREGGSSVLCVLTPHLNFLPPASPKVPRQALHTFLPFCFFPAKITSCVCVPSCHSSSAALPACLPLYSCNVMYALNCVISKREKNQQKQPVPLNKLNKLNCFLAFLLPFHPYSVFPSLSIIHSDPLHSIPPPPQSANVIISCRDRRSMYMYNVCGNVCGGKEDEWNNGMICPGLRPASELFMRNLPPYLPPACHLPGNVYACICICSIYVAL